ARAGPERQPGQAALGIADTAEERCAARGTVAAGWLHHDHVRAEIGEDPAGQPAGLVAAVEDPQAAQHGPGCYRAPGGPPGTPPESGPATPRGRAGGDLA